MLCDNPADIAQSPDAWLAIVAIGICTSYNSSQCLQGSTFQVVFTDEVIKRAFIAIVREFYIRYIKRYSIELLRFCYYLVEWDINNLSLLINKAFNKPRTGYTVYLGTLACNPFISM
jgi:hypothetical protein